MIQSFRCEETHHLFIRRTSRRWSSILSVALRKLDQMEAATDLKDLRIPPGNRLEALSGSRKSQQSIRINEQWRICFIWGQNGPENVKIIDYH